MGSIDDFLDDENTSVDDILSSGETSSKNTEQEKLNQKFNLSSGNKFSEEEVHAALIKTTVGALSSFENSALVVAMAELLDEMSDGKLKLYHQRLESERMIAVTASSIVIMGYMKALLEEVKKQGAMASPFYGIFLKVNVEFNEFLKNHYVEVYKEACAKLGADIDNELISTGVYSEQTQYRRYGMSSPPARNDNGTTI